MVWSAGDRGALFAFNLVRGHAFETHKSRTSWIGLTRKKETTKYMKKREFSGYAKPDIHLWRLPIAIYKSSIEFVLFSLHRTYSSWTDRVYVFDAKENVQCPSLWLRIVWQTLDAIFECVCFLNVFAIHAIDFRQFHCSSHWFEPLMRLLPFIVYTK